MMLYNIYYKTNTVNVNIILCDYSYKILILVKNICFLRDTKLKMKTSSQFPRLKIFI